MAMGTPWPTRYHRPAARPVARPLEQILAAIAGMERRLEARDARWEERLVEGLPAVVPDANEREERMAARLLADAGEREVRLKADAEGREKRLAAKLLAMDAVEEELALKAKWDVK